MKSTTVREPEWDEHEQAMMLALAEYRACVCDGCGGWLPDTTTPDADSDFDVAPPVKCHQCVAIAITADAFASNGKHPHLARWQAKRRHK